MISECYQLSRVGQHFPLGAQSPHARTRAPTFNGVKTTESDQAKIAIIINKKLELTQQ